MPYVGNKPEVGNFRKCDAITTSATATYNLLVGGVAVNPNQNQCIVSLNGVVQSSGDSFTCASSQITFASALTSSDVIDFILILGDTLNVGTVSDDTIGLAQLSATGTPSSSNYLRGDNSWQTVSGTTINNNADNRVITGSGTANTLEGEANVTYADPKLMVANSGDSTFEIQSGNSNSCRLNFGDTDSSTIGQIRYRHDLNKMIVEVNGSSRLEIDNNGAVKATSRMIIDNDGNSSYKLNAEFGGSSESGAYMNDKDGANNATYFNFRRQGTEIGNIIRNGTNDAVAYNTSSDYRLKDGIVDKTDGIEKLKQLKPRKFYWKSNEDKTLVDGFIAHEVSSVVPEAISGEKDAVDENGDIKPQGIDQSKLVPLLTGALQEAITKIETLEARVQTLEDA